MGKLFLVTVIAAITAFAGSAKVGGIPSTTRTTKPEFGARLATTEASTP